MKKETFDELLTSVEQGGRILRGKKAPSRSFRIDNPNVLAIRRHLGLTQQKFAGLLGISPATLRNWEQGEESRKAPLAYFSVSRQNIQSCFGYCAHVTPKPRKPTKKRASSDLPEALE